VAKSAMLAIVIAKCYKFTVVFRNKHELKIVPIKNRRILSFCIDRNHLGK
jgi:hypothetical protein